MNTTVASKLILGHRGFRAMYPENTGLAFDRAIEGGADGFECDIQKTRDGSFVIIHDGTVERTALDGAKGAVSDMTLSDIKRINFGGNEQILTLEEVLAKYKGCFINFELKDETLRPDDGDAIEAILKRDAAKENLLISSFRHDLLPLFKERGYKTGMLLRTIDILMHPMGTYRRFAEFRPDYINLPVNTLLLPWSLYTRGIVAGARSLGIKILLWTVNSKKDFAAARKYADIIVSDNVATAIESSGNFRK
jgi:glycerophosphoryl diester phosphodiesterase